MIQLHTRENCIIGLTKADVERLQRGDDIAFDFPRRETFKNLVFLYEENKLAILQRVEKLGFVLSKEYYAEAEKDPT